MSKIRRGGHSAEGGAAFCRARRISGSRPGPVRTRRIRRTVIIVAVLTILVLFATGAVGSSIARRKGSGGYGRHRAGPGRPAGRSRPASPTRMRWQQMSGSLCGDGRRQLCWFTVLNGTRLNSIQSGYARPAIAAGKTRFVLYNRSGNELRVESRTQNLYTKNHGQHHLPVRRGRRRAGGCCDRQCRQRGSADRLQFQHAAAAGVEPDQRAGRTPCAWRFRRTAAALP